MTQDYIPFADIVAEISRLCKQKSTGTLFVATKANKSAQLVLDKGEIVFIFFSSKRGEEALALMSTIRAGRYRFQEGGVIPRRMPLPPTQTILERLGREAEQPSSPEQRPAAAAPSAGGGLSREQKDVLEACLAECIGPMAAIICEDHLHSGANFEAVVEALAAEIPSPGQAAKFRELVTAKLG
jgi:hypothetical protein